MDQIAIEATKRQVLGKKVKGLRKQGKLPAILYGFNVPTTEIEINEREFKKAFKQAGESSILNLVLEGKSQPVLIHDVQRHYLNDQPIHVDFFAVNMAEKVKVKVPLHFVGESPAVKALGGTLVKNISEVEVECLPADLPQNIEIDISKLNTFEDAIRISDIKASGKFEIIANPEEVVANVAAPRSEEELKSLEETVTEDVSKVEGVVKPEAETKEAEEGAEEQAPTKEKEVK